jgi:hypothetical protein
MAGSARPRNEEKPLRILPTQQKPGAQRRSSVVSQKFVAYFGITNRRSFDYVWRKSAPNSAQDDTSVFNGRMTGSSSTNQDDTSVFYEL